jgi:hypothetical protein
MSDLEVITKERACGEALQSHHNPRMFSAAN